MLAACLADASSADAPAKLTGTYGCSYNWGVSLNKEQRLEPLEVAHKVVEVAEEKQASDILLLDIRELSSFADFFVILTAESRRQMEALAQDMVQQLKQSGSTLHHREGGLDSGWLLLDFGDVIAHLFAPQERDYYRLEERWSRAKHVVRIQ